MAAKKAFEDLRAVLLKRGVGSIKSFGRTFRIFDDDGNRSLNKEEFMEGMKDYGLAITDEKCDLMFAEMDKDDSGQVNFDEFLRQLKTMNASRIALVEKAFAKFDKNGDGVVTVDDMKGVYNVRCHPKVVNGDWTEEQALAEFLKSYDTAGQRDDKITKDEFLAYYEGVSASVDNDAYFDLMVRQAWKL